MTRFLYGEVLWKTIKSRCKKAKRTKAAVAYVTTPTALSLKSGDVLVVDATDAAIAAGRTSATVLANLYRKGVAIYNHNGLHAKVIVADAVLFSSSANLSESSDSKLLEAGIETDNPNAVSGAVGMIEKLVESSKEVDTTFLTRIKKIKVEKHFGGGSSKARKTAKGHRDPVTWLLGVHNISEPTDSDELKRIETGIEQAEQFLSNPKSSVEWIRYGRKDRISEGRRGDNFVMIDSESKRIPQRVYRHANILRVQVEPTCTRVFYEDPPSAEKKSMRWSRFKKLAQAVGLGKRVSPNSFRVLADETSEDLNRKWDSFRGK